jgi:hypothetical protein
MKICFGPSARVVFEHFAYYEERISREMCLDKRELNIIITVGAGGEMLIT